MFFRNGSKFTLETREDAHKRLFRRIKAPSAALDFRDRRCTRNGIHFAISCEHKESAYMSRHRTQCRTASRCRWRASYIPLDWWMDAGKSRDTSRRYMSKAVWVTKQGLINSRLVGARSVSFHLSSLPRSPSTVPILYLSPAKQTVHIHGNHSLLFISLSPSFPLSLSLSFSFSSPLRSVALFCFKCSRSGTAALYTSSFISRKCAAGVTFSVFFPILRASCLPLLRIRWYGFCLCRGDAVGHLLSSISAHFRLFCRIDVIPYYFHASYPFSHKIVIFPIIIQTRMKFKLEDPPTFKRVLHILLFISRLYVTD